MRQEWDKMAEYTNEVFPMDNKMLTLEEDFKLNPDVDDEGNVIAKAGDGEEKPSDELQDAKFDLISDDKDEKDDLLETGEENIFISDDENDEGLSRIEAEIARLREEIEDPD